MGKSASSISSQASAAASSLSKASAASSSSLASVVSKASASASAEANKQGLTSTYGPYTTYAVAIGIFTVIIGALVALHFSGRLDPLYKKIAEKYFKAQAKAEMIALQKTGSKKAEGYLKEQLKDNPAANVGEGELDDIAKGGDIGDKLGKVGGGVGDKLGL